MKKMRQQQCRTAFRTLMREGLLTPKKIKGKTVYCVSKKGMLIELEREPKPKLALRPINQTGGVNHAGEFRDRNLAIYRAKAAGRTTAEVAREYSISETRVDEIVRTVQRHLYIRKDEYLGARR